MRGPGRSAKMRLPRFIESAARLSGATALSGKQAKQMVKLIEPWRKRPTMSEAAGQTLFTGLTNTLTAAQKTAMEKDRPRFGGPGGGGPGGPGGGGRMGGPGGGGRGQGQGRPGGGGGRMEGGGPGGGMGQPPTQAQMDKMRSMMASYNPLYTGTSAGFASLPDPIKKGMQRRRDRVTAALSQIQKKAR